MQSLRLAGFAARSRVNGPGRRIVLWVQGCDLACPGCFNPHTHAAEGPGEPVDAVVARVLAAQAGHDGVTFSGGEPFQQAEALAAVARGIRAGWPAARLLAFTGYRLAELRGPAAPPGAAALLAALDWLVDGRYEARQPSTRRWRGSANQRLWVVGRPLPPDVFAAPAPDAELHVAEGGQVLLSGFPDPKLRRAVQKLDH
ncbi:MAG: radical SAM protein [Myxococcales bacterium]|nr:radical SAM protein [Myxococcales bacterium]